VLLLPTVGLEIKTNGFFGPTNQDKCFFPNKSRLTGIFLIGQQNKPNIFSPNNSRQMLFIGHKSRLGEQA